MTKPIVFIDVDGVLNPTFSNKQAKKNKFDRYRITVDGWRYTVYLNKLHGNWLKELDAELVWATTWEYWANEYIGPKIDLYDLPVVEFGKNKRKPNDLIKYANGRAFVWLDDDINDEDLLSLRNYNCLPRSINHTIGLSYDDIQNAGEWLNENNKS